MGFTKISKDMGIITVLQDTPSLTASELKGKFDEGGKALKEFLNNTLIPEIEDAVDGKQSKIIICQGEPSGGNDGDIIVVC